MPEEPEKYTPFDKLTDDELKVAMVMHIKMGYILANPGRSKEAMDVAQDIVSRLTIDQLKQIHPNTFFTNKMGSGRPQNPYLLAKEILGTLPSIGSGVVSQ